MSTIEILKDSENKLLSRRELTVVFRGGSGLITRPAAAEAISSRMGVQKDKVSVVSLQGKFGLRDLVGKVYIYTSAGEMKKQLPGLPVDQGTPKS